MNKTAELHFRLDPEARAALEIAAMRDERTVSQLARKIVMEWLRSQDRRRPERARAR